MFEHTRLLFLFCETPLHAGSGAGLGAVDLPLQRERATNYPMIQSSGVKGAVRSLMPTDGADGKITQAIFGESLNDSRGAPEWASAIAFADARIIAFPVRSLQGVYVWVTCRDVLARLERDLRQMGAPGFASPPNDQPAQAQPDAPGSANEPQKGFTLSEAPARGEACVVKNRGRYSPVIPSPGAQAGKIYLEEYDFTVDARDAKDIAGWLAGNAVPAGYEHWRERLREALVILHDDDFRDFVTFSTEVVTRVALIPETKTVREGALWTEEYLPADSLLYVPVHATKLRVPNTRKQELGVLPDELGTAEGIVSWVAKQVKERAGDRMQIGGNETIARGIVDLRWFPA